MSEYRLNEEDLAEFEAFFRYINTTEEVNTQRAVAAETVEDTAVAVSDEEVAPASDVVEVTPEDGSITEESLNDIIIEMYSLLEEEPERDQENYTNASEEEPEEEYFEEYLPEDEEEEDEYYPSEVDPIDSEISATVEDLLQQEDPEDTETSADNTEEVSLNPELIPENSNTLLIDETTSRFSGAIWYEKIQEKYIMLAGVGGIGSYVAFLLSRMNPAYIYLYDDDEVESVNLSGQFFSMDNVGTKKVLAITNKMANYSNYHNVIAYSNRYSTDFPAQKIMMCGFDNMEARKIYYNNWKKFIMDLPPHIREECLFIDGRLAAEDFQVLCIRGDDEFNMNRYEQEFLFSSEEAEQTICSYKQTSFTANMIASVMVNLFVNFVANECDPVIPRDLPFLTEYNAELMYFNTEN